MELCSSCMYRMQKVNFRKAKFTGNFQLDGLYPNLKQKFLVTDMRNNAAYEDLSSFKRENKDTMVHMLYHIAYTTRQKKKLLR